MKQLQAIKGEMERVNLEIQSAEREYDLNRAAELKYGVLAGLQKQLQKAEDDLRQQVCEARSLCQVLGLRFHPPIRLAKVQTLGIVCFCMFLQCFVSNYYFTSSISLHIIWVCTVTRSFPPIRVIHPGTVSLRYTCADAGVQFHH